MIGATISHYRITGKLGEGGMGVVYRAEDVRLERPVALKFLPPGAISDAERRRFLQEARAAARIRHPAICAIYDMGEEDGQMFFAMALVEGRPLNSLIRGEPMPLRKAADIAGQLAEALQAAHEHGIVHRDIKPGNIMVCPDGKICVLDFGIALREDADRLTKPGSAVGTPSYMSPEQARGAHIDHRTDLWALGVVLYEMVTGRLPFRSDKAAGVVYSIVHENPEFPGEMPPALQSFLRRAMAKNPDERWSSAADMARELRAMRDGTTQSTLTIAQTPPPVRAKPSGRRALALSLLAGLALLAAGGGYMYRRSTALPEQKHIAVLPLQVVGATEELRALSDGLVQTITSKLTQIQEFEGKLIVVPASEIRDRKIDSAEKARRTYGANLVIGGSAQKLGDRLQFEFVLIDTAKTQQLASETFELDASRPLAIRDKAVYGVLRMLAVKLSAPAERSIAAGETMAQGAYGDYLRGAGYLARYDLSGNVDRAIAALTRAVEQDTRYAIAWAALGEAYWRQAAIRNDKQIAESAVNTIRRAIQLDPALPEAHVQLGQILIAKGEREEGVKQIREALRRAPQSARAMQALGDGYTSLGRFDEAEQWYRAAAARQPSDWAGHVALGYFYINRGRDEEARKEFEAARTLSEDNEVVYRNLAVISLRAGRYKEASDMLSRSAKFEPLARTYSTLGIALYYQHRYDEAVAALLSSVSLNSQRYISWGNLGTVYSHIPGKEAQAKDAFATAIALAEKVVDMTPGDFDTHADLAEYYARTGDKTRSMAEIEKIPVSSRSSAADQLTVAYELTGQRDKAVGIVRSLRPNDSSLNYLRNDPDLQTMWKEEGLR